MALTNDSKKIFFGMMGSPYVDETVTSLFRLVSSALRQNHTVVVWCCGGATHLASAANGSEKPVNIMGMVKDQLRTPSPTTGHLIATLVETYPKQLNWLNCRHCAEEHGVMNTVPQASRSASVKFAHYSENADHVIILGIK